MKIQINEIQLNKTKRFLLPCLRVYGEKFEKMLTSVFKVGIGIGDILLTKRAGVVYEQHLFVLVDTKSFVPGWKAFIKWIREEEQSHIYEDDYIFDDIGNGRLHMIVIKLPENCYKPLQWMKHSQFSKMYSAKQISEYFKENSTEKRILVKDQDYKVHYTNKLNELYGTSVNPNELEGELEMPTKKDEEVFNIQIFK